MIRKLIAPVILAVAACAPINRLSTPRYEMEWPNVVHRASLAADSGSYASADLILATYARQYPRTHEARETLFWRALYKLDPANKNGSLAAGLATLDEYLADSSTILYRSEGTVLKRLAATTQLLEAKALTPPVRDSTIVRAAHDAEVAQLREQLVRTTAELERIKKRLADPNK